MLAQRQVGIRTDDGLNWLFFVDESLATVDFEPLPPRRDPLTWGPGLDSQWRTWLERCVDFFVSPPDVQSGFGVPVGIDPPGFDSLADLPELRERCRARWPEFEAWNASRYRERWRLDSERRLSARRARTLMGHLPERAGLGVSVVALTSPRLLLTARRVDDGFTRIAAVVTAGLLRDPDGLEASIISLL